MHAHFFFLSPIYICVPFLFSPFSFKVPVIEEEGARLGIRVALSHFEVVDLKEAISRLGLCNTCCSCVAVVAVCCSVLQYVAVCCVAVVLQCVA